MLFGTNGELQYPAAEVGQIYAFAGRGKQNLLHQLAYIVRERVLGAPAAVELVGEVERSSL